MRINTRISIIMAFGILALVAIVAIGSTVYRDRLLYGGEMHEVVGIEGRLLPGGESFKAIGLDKIFL